MQIILQQPAVQKYIQFTEREFETFPSRTIVNGVEYNFYRYVTMGNYRHSGVYVNNGISLGLGEDPRAFNLLGTPACYAVHYNQYDIFVPKLIFKDGDDWITVEMETPKEISPGKNWSPFVYNNEVYFVHEVSPFRVLKLSGDKLSVVFTQDVETERMSIDNYSVLRGGCNGLDIGNGLVLGFGHNNYASNPKDIYTIKHRPYGWCIDMVNNSATIIDIAFDFNSQYNIIDPTALLQINGEYYLQTIETEVVWNKLNQQARSCLYKLTIEL